MVIIKLGGSLAKSGALIDCLNTVDNRFQGRAVVIVPGGGDFADQVRLAQRRWRFDDGTAHRMAVLAMQQMALMCHGLKPHFAIAGPVRTLRELLNRQRPVIWLPEINELDSAGIPAGWEVTSDSLAAWLATALSADELILVKSARIDASLGLTRLAGEQAVDSAFCDFVAHATFKITIINQQDFNG